MMLKDLKQNADDIYAKQGFRAATCMYILTNLGMMYLGHHNPEQSDILKTYVAPAFYVAGNIAGLCNKPRTTSTISLGGTVALGLSFAGVVGHHACQWGSVAIATAASIGQGLQSYLAPKKLFASGKKEKPVAEEFKKNIWSFGFVKGSAIQSAVDTTILTASLASRDYIMAAAASGWLLADMVKFGWALTNAKRELKKQEQVKQKLILA